MRIEQRSDSGLSAVATRFRSPSDIVALTEFDLGLFAASWDARCLRVRDIEGLACRFSMLLQFDNRGVLGLQDEHDRALVEFLSSATTEERGLTQFRSPAESLAVVWRELRRHLATVVREIGRPIRIALDLSACPRVFSLGLLAFGMRRGLVRSATIFYSPAVRYGTEKNTAVSPHLFTDGSWTPYTIPGVSGHVDTTGVRHIVASVGFEGAKIRRTVTALEPEKVTLLYPIPPYVENFELTNRAAGRAIEAEYGLNSKAQLEVGAGDAVGVWRALRECHTGRDRRSSSMYLCCGTKPHSLGMALTALEFPEIPVFYMKPGSHREVPVVPKMDEYWCYEIEDRRNMY